MTDFPYTAEQEAWLQDLETTDALQGKFWLHMADQWCCLGRGCLVLGMDGFAPKMDRGEILAYCFGEDDEASSLPDDAVDRLKLRSETGKFMPPDDAGIPVSAIGCNGSCALSNLNDGGWTFKEIAAFIRKYPSVVFTNLDTQP